MSYNKNYLDIKMPEISWGSCKARKHRGKMICDLANGYCMPCWDHGSGGLQPHFVYENRKVQRRKKEQNE